MVCESAEPLFKAMIWMKDGSKLPVDEQIMNAGFGAAPRQVPNLKRRIAARLRLMMFASFGCK